MKDDETDGPNDETLFSLLLGTRKIARALHREEKMCHGGT
jgi:hypothetical protein